MSSPSRSQGTPCNQTNQPSSTAAHPLPPSSTRDPRCSHISDHEAHRYCRWCNSITVPWGTLTPPVGLDPDGTTVRIGPVHSILEGVNLIDTNELVIVGIVADYGLQVGVPGVPTGSRLAGFTTPILNAAGRRLTELVLELRTVWAGSATSQAISVMEVMLLALESPRLGFMELRNSILSRFPERFETPVTEEPMEKQAVVDSDGDHDCPKDSSVGNLDQSSSLQQRHKNAPAPSGNWQFIVGSDLSLASVGNPQASKFYLTRVDTRNLQNIDTRMFPSIAAFDWGGKDAVRRLNNWRRQIITRTNGASNAPRPPYTQKEIDTLKCILQTSINQGKTRKTMDWHDVASQLNSAFKGVLQKKGEPISQTSKKRKDGTVVRSKGDGTLKQDRTEINRDGTSVKTQSCKYLDIQEMFEAGGNKVVGGKSQEATSVRGTKRKAQELEESSEESGDEDAKVGPRNKGPRTPLPGSRHNKHPPPPPPPPPSGASLSVA